ncbi:MAG: methionine--tRNA ligase [Polyangiaceae bacterium]|nr:methionine--tRNA ligase [Polyangiaceae bacterium]
MSLQKRPFYVTTPIYYVNDVPHLGHAYTSTVADALRRFHLLRGRDARMLTGTDEHGLKIDRAAKEQGVTPQAFTDAVSQRFRDAWPKLNVRADDFIRTTEPRHIEFVQSLWKVIADKGFLYKGAYEAWYCVGCETFKTEKDLLPGNLCDIHKKPVERVKEETYFFKLSAFQDRLLAFYEAHPGFIRPETRKNEVVSFVKSGLDDLSVSRTSFSWGIPVPGDDKHVMFVWFDALANYRSALEGNDAHGKPLRRYWGPEGEVVHLMGKDILRFHAVYWPAFLMAAGYTDAELPEAVHAHGFLTIDGEKMSKMTGNVVDPLRVAEEFGADVLRYYLLRAVSFGQDGDFDHAGFIERYNADLGKNLGNLVQRTIGMCAKYTNLKVPDAGVYTALDTELVAGVQRELQKAADAWTAIEPHAALEATMAASSLANTYVDRAAPWAAFKDGDLPRVGTILHALLDVVARLSIAIYPAMPDKSDRVRAQLGLSPISALLDHDAWPLGATELTIGAALPPGTPLFPMYDKEQTELLLAKLRPAKAPAMTDTPAAPVPAPTAAAAPAPAAPEAPPAPITYDQFSAVDLRVGLVVACEKVPKKDKLLKLQVDLGEPEPRTIIAGLALTFTPETLVGRRVVVVANLAPRDFGKGLVSHGMLLASGPSEALHLASIDEGVAPGSKLK